MTDVNTQMRSLLRSTVVWDNHACLPMRADASFMPQLERCRKAGVNVLSLNVGFADMSWSEHIRILSFMRKWLAQHPDSFSLLSSVEDIHRCKAEGKLGIVFDVEGMCPVQNEISFVQTFYELGVRWMLVAYNLNNAAGGGCLDVDTGLTNVGQTIIDEMERVGMVLCLSHTGARTAMEAIEYSRNPAIFSHSNPFGDTQHPRNVSDALMQACARKGGVVGLSGMGPFLGDNNNLLNALVRQLRYVIDLIGPEHVGLGLDYVFDRVDLAEHVRLNPTLYPPGISGAIAMIEPEAIANIAESLGRDNFSDTQISGILGENWLRVAKHVWR